MLIAITGACAVGVGVAITGAQARPDSVGPTPTLQDQILQTAPDDRAKLDALVLRIAAEYTSYKRVSDRANWAPTLCRIPPPAGIQSSRSTDADTHGRKLYYLYAADGDSYFRIGADESKPWVNPVGQVMVKESFKPLRVTHAEGKDTFEPGDRAGLFVIIKFDAAAKGTDEGWVYATTSPDAKVVTAAGAIASCMECHDQTTRDHLYGLRGTWRKGEHGQPLPPVRPRVADRDSGSSGKPADGHDAVK